FAVVFVAVTWAATFILRRFLHPWFHRARRASEMVGFVLSSYSVYYGILIGLPRHRVRGGLRADPRRFGQGYRHLCHRLLKAVAGQFAGKSQPEFSCSGASSFCGTRRKCRRALARIALSSSRA